MPYAVIPAAAPTACASGTGTMPAPSWEANSGEPDELRHLVRFLSARVAGEEEARSLTGQVCDAIVPLRDHRWPGNFRELEQCVRSVMLRGSYSPPGSRPASASTGGR
ncbi:MAG TPA: hypothetical protein VGR02_09270 [Thermoanaerobaculia bacterium]|jgi:hypothetical protein|nr:hypothetical protein [Thermoanaerobaculia bacterium]